MHQLENVRERLSRNINTRAMNLLNKAEEQHTDMLKKKKIVETDRIKILETIESLDAKKRETLLQAWEQVKQFIIYEYLFFSRVITSGKIRKKGKIKM